MYRTVAGLMLLFALPMTLAGNQEESTLWQAGINVIPCPQEVKPGGEDFLIKPGVGIALDQKAAPEDRFAAEELAAGLRSAWGIEAAIGGPAAAGSIVLTRQGAPKKGGDQGYRLETAGGRLVVRAGSSCGLFYGVQTLLQLIQKGREGPYVKGVEINDWPDIPVRAVHYDSKHFQEKREYVEEFIRTLARYKINMLIWEWEDKLAYRSHPEIGAPGAFTMKEMQDFTRLARKYQIQLVPLVQGLGHVSYILKWPQYAYLREIPSSNWQFCPLKDGTYELLFDLYGEAIEATPGSEYIHIGTDEAWAWDRELGAECGCRAKAEEVGFNGLKQLFIHRVSRHLTGLGRKVMSWGGEYQPDEKIKPPKGLITFNYEVRRDRRQPDYPIYLYDPNPGIEHLFLPYFYRLRDEKEVPGCLEMSYKAVSTGALTGLFDGMVATSWNCSGVHNQLWMLRYIVAAEYSWSGKAPAYNEFKEKYFKNYYGPQSLDMPELFLLLNKASYYYMDNFERKVWHWGEVGKTHLPDLPRDDLEYDPYWNTEYRGMVERSRAVLPQMERVKNICSTNLALGVNNSYDFELFTGLAELFEHTARTYLALSELENAITQAHRKHFSSHQAAYEALKRAERIIEENLEERGTVFNKIKATWEKSQLPKGMSTPEKKYLHARDQQRNFANRRPDLSFMIYDEELLGLEDYLARLREYMQWYSKTYLGG
ncbi:MAG TPA: beta-N-acetylhexosaminidase [archaeon]|nr:beta-N-acetylhexosaminidase [archaeon]